MATVEEEEEEGSSAVMEWDERAEEGRREGAASPLSWRDWKEGVGEVTKVGVRGTGPGSSTSLGGGGGE